MSKIKKFTQRHRVGLIALALFSWGGHLAFSFIETPQDGSVKGVALKVVAWAISLLSTSFIFYLLTDRLKRPQEFEEGTVY